MQIKAIETNYNGIRFRSRLEARWAVFFDAMGYKYQYEPEGYVLDDGTKYLPDFYLPDFDVHFEVKPNIPESFDDIQRCKKFVDPDGPIKTIVFLSDIPKSVDCWLFRCWTCEATKNQYEDLKGLTDAYKEYAAEEGFEIDLKAVNWSWFGFIPMPESYSDKLILSGVFMIHTNKFCELDFDLAPSNFLEYMPISMKIVYEYVEKYGQLPPVDFAKDSIDLHIDEFRKSREKLRWAYFSANSAKFQHLENRKEDVIFDWEKFYMPDISSYTPDILSI